MSPEVVNITLIEDIWYRRKLDGRSLSHSPLRALGYSEIDINDISSTIWRKAKRNADEHKHTRTTLSLDALYTYIYASFTNPTPIPYIQKHQLNQQKKTSKLIYAQNSTVGKSDMCTFAPPYGTSLNVFFGPTHVLSSGGTSGVTPIYSGQLIWQPDTVM